jgi:hypothetical protein
VSVELFYDGLWHEIAPDVLAAGQIRVTRGQTDDGYPRPAQIALSINNRTDQYRPSNPTSPLYGKAGRNTPVRVSVGGTVRQIAEATSWSPDRSVEFDQATDRGVRWVDLDANGMLYRIQKWVNPLRSPFYRLNAAYATSVGYFPLEDPRGTTSVFSPVAGARAGALRGATFQSQEHPDGSDPLMDVARGAYIEGYFARVASTTAGWQLSFLVKLPSNPVTGTFAEFWDWTLADGSFGALVFVDTTLTVFLTTAAGVTVVNQTVDVSGTDWTKWNMVRVKSSVSAGTVTVEVSWFTEGSTVFATFNGTYAAADTSSLAGWGVTGLIFTAGATYGHVLGISGVADDLDSSDRVTALAGYRGETAGARFVRLCGEEGVPATLLGSAATTRPMGPQVSATLVQTLQEIASTDDAMIFDDRDFIRLVMRTRAHRYNQTPALTLSFTTAGQIVPPFKEVLDDLETHNWVTVSQRGGGSAEAILTTGPTSIQPPPAGVGEEKTTVDVNVADEADDLPLLAGWWLNRGTLARPRYPSVSIDLLGSPGLVAAAAAANIGDLITVSGYEPDVIPLIVIGIVEAIGSHTRKMIFTTAPADLFITGVYDGTARRYDSASTVTNASYAAGVGTVVFKTTNPGDLWSTVSTPYDCVCAGERFTVTAMAAATGTGPYLQTATVTRGANGINKQLDAGESIRIANPGRYAL